MLGLNIFSNLKTIAVSLLAISIASVAIFAWSKHKSALDKISDLEGKISQEVEKNKQISLNYNLIKSVNKKNEDFINYLQEDATKKERLINDFKIQKYRDNKKIEEYKAIVQTSPAEDDGEISKVLKDTLIVIQKDREERIK